MQDSEQDQNLMEITMNKTHALVLITICTLFVGCRARQWDESSGVMDSDAPSGRVSIRCFENIENSDKPVWFFQVSGAHSSTDREQPLMVTVQQKVADNAPTTIASEQSGRGAMSDNEGFLLDMSQVL